MMKLKLTNLTNHLADTSFYGEEMEDDVDSVCLVRTISRQINPDNPLLVVRETAKDPILSQLMRFVKEGWPHAFSEELKDFKKLENSLSTENGCVFYGLRVIIPSTLRNHILELLHLGHFGVQHMEQLARSTVYWPRIDFDIENLCRKCTSCGQFQNKPDKPSIHPWMMPEKPWSRLHLDHAINFLGRNWLVLVDAYSKYPCIHPTTSTSSKSTTAILERVPSLVQTTRHCTSHRSTLSSSNKRCCRAFDTILQTGIEKILVTSKGSFARISNAI